MPSVALSLTCCTRPFAVSMPMACGVVKNSRSGCTSTGPRTCALTRKVSVSAFGLLVVRFTVATVRPTGASGGALTVARYFHDPEAIGALAPAGTGLGGAMEATTSGDGTITTGNL